MEPELPWLRPIMADEYALTTRISLLRVKILLEAPKGYSPIIYQYMYVMYITIAFIKTNKFCIGISKFVDAYSYSKKLICVYIIIISLQSTTIIDMRSTGSRLFYIVSCREILGSAAI
jgi:hypothetical protein